MITSKASNKRDGNIPRFFELLCEEDKEEYFKIQKDLAYQDSKNQRNKSTEAFIEAVRKVHTFITRDNKNDILRSLVCGLIWLKNGIAINTHQLRVITCKCKSTINHSFQTLGYGALPYGSDQHEQLYKMLPFLKDNFNEQRQWTIRQKYHSSTELIKLADIVTKKELLNDFITPPPFDLQFENNQLEIAIHSSKTVQNQETTKAMDFNDASFEFIQGEDFAQSNDDDPCSFFCIDGSIFEPFDDFEATFID